MGGVSTFICSAVTGFLFSCSHRGNRFCAVATLSASCREEGVMDAPKLGAPSVLTSVRSYPAPTPCQPCLWFCNNKCCLPRVGLCLPSPPTLPSSDSGPGRPGETNGGNGTIPLSACSPAFQIGDWCFFLLSGDTFGSWTGRLAVTLLWRMWDCGLPG